MSAWQRLVPAVLAVLALAMTASCSDQHAAANSAGDAPPATVKQIGHGHLHRITLTPIAAKRIALATGTVGTVTTASGAPTLRVPAAAVFYRPDGSTWVYVRTARLTFERARVVLTRVVRNTAELRSGPPVGTAVVTVGVAELRGVEDGVPGEQ